MVVFSIFETILLQVGATWKGLHTNGKTKLNMVCNKLKNILRKLPPFYRYHGNSDTTVSKSQNRQMQLVRRFCIAEHEDIWHNQQLNVDIILIFCFLIYNWCKA